MKSEVTEKSLSVPEAPYPDLKALRESRGKTLQEISQTTRIRVVYLEAIESADFKALPERVYAENFIGIYAHEIGIDGSPLIAHYRKYVQDQAALAGEEVKARKESPRPVKERVDVFRWLKEKFPAGRWAKAHLKAWVWTAAFLVVVSAIFLFLYNDETPESDESKAPAIVTAEKPQGESTGLPAEPPKEGGQEGTAPQAAATAQPQAGVKPEAAPAKAPLTMVITAREMTWVRIVEDQNPPYQLLLRPGDRVERQAEAIFSLDIGNAGGIDIEFQGRSLGRLGKEGEVIHLILPETAGPR